MRRLLQWQRTKPSSHRHRRLFERQFDGAFCRTWNSFRCSWVARAAVAHACYRDLCKHDRRTQQMEQTLIRALQLRLTPKESDRLRQVSYERQLEKGMSRPGYAGLVPERFGDAEPFQSAIRHQKLLHKVTDDKSASPGSDVMEAVESWMQEPRKSYQP